MTRPLIQERVVAAVRGGVNWRSGGITFVTMNRPEKRNAMSPELHYEMDRVLAELETDPNTRCLVLTGAGDAFSAGQDLKKFFRELDDKPEERKRATEAANRWTPSCSKPR